MALGAAGLFNKMGRRGIRPYVLPQLTDLIPNRMARNVVEYIVFVGLGCVVGLFFVAPNTAIQAFSAGLGWTGLLANPEANRG